ncbi:MAG: zinc ribbon domain-containing protein [Acidobacteria bacterium]|nr:MAG: zinc ribbon domain-containing protein [Acidobacteriota bacterium]
MPAYEFVCKECLNKFTLVLSIAEYEKLLPSCPKCKGRKIEQLPAVFFAVTARKS